MTGENEDQDGHQDDGNGHESDEEHQDGQEGRDGPEDGSDAETFPRKYVEELRQESKGYRDRAKKGEAALSRLTELTIKESTTGILIDPSDLTFDEETMTDDDGFPDPEKIKEAAEELVSKKPHLAPRRPRGDIGQGAKGKDDDFSLAGILRSNAG